MNVHSVMLNAKTMLALKKHGTIHTDAKHHHANLHHADIRHDSQSKHQYDHDHQAKTKEGQCYINRLMIFVSALQFWLLCC